MINARMGEEVVMDRDKIFEQLVKINKALGIILFFTVCIAYLIFLIIVFSGR